MCFHQSVDEGDVGQVEQKKCDGGRIRYAVHVVVRYHFQKKNDYIYIYIYIYAYVRVRVYNKLPFTTEHVPIGRKR